MTGVATLPVVEVRALTKRYGAHTVFEAVDLTVRAGEIVAIVGESGVGKSTLLNCIAGLDAADSGDVRVMGEAVARLPEAEQARLRRRHIGFVFQAFHVLPHLTVAQNVALPLLLLGGGDDRERVQRALAQVGLADLGERLPAQLSGGQLQRVAIARALIHRPALLLADEPSGNLDPRTAESVLDALVEQVRGHGAACLLVTHSPAAAARADRILELTPQGLRPREGAAAPPTH
ncbi:ABC transporter ATP-binding protein [Caldimonas aquatica]|uniref:ABC transporter ATP-binding protein n=1 Tax=Caldimonas aquatica TaxID=376175 RepID=A0ABY6MVS8_9BURK|nr:ABC transporter ATP-binding protein [Schlegelella aquatica]UZD56111.1 ABC transporter ATP-binding protein [Schlegelella aquatica]